MCKGRAWVAVARKRIQAYHMLSSRHRRHVSLDIPKALCLTSPISTYHPCPCPATKSLPTTLSPGPVARSACPEHMGLQDTPTSGGHCAQPQGGCQRKTDPGHLPSVSSHSRRQRVASWSLPRHNARHGVSEYTVEFRGN